MMKIVIIGAVAGGTSAAAKARRNNEKAEIIIYEKGNYISYSGCGMPYYISREVEGRNNIIPRGVEYFKNTYNIDIKINHEVTKIDSKKKVVHVKNLLTEEEFISPYDKLVISTGARANLIPVKGVNLPHVFVLRSIENMDQIKQHVDKSKVKHATVIGSGFIGLEMVEAFAKLGLSVTLVEKLKQVSPSLDEDMAEYVKNYIESNGVKVYLDANVEEITTEYVTITKDNKRIDIKSDIVLVAAGAKPNVELAVEAGIELGKFKAIKVNERLETNVKDIYACGDCIEEWDVNDKTPMYRPLGSTANKTGRIVGDNITGGNSVFKGILGTSIYRVFDMAVAQTGKTEKDAANEKLDVIVSHNIKPNKPEYMGGKDMVIKTVATKDGVILGAQIVGFEGVDKRIDVLATSIYFKANAKDLEDLDLAYAPPFSTARDPINYTGMIIDNIVSKNRPLITPKDLLAGDKDNPRQIIDTRGPLQYGISHINGSINIPQLKIRSELHNLNKNIPTIVYCVKGLTANAVQNTLINNGFKDVKNLSGGYANYINCEDLYKK